MKKRLLMLLSLFMAVTSVGWIHAQDGPSISTDLTVAQTGKEIVFGITTKKGNAEDMFVAASLKADNGTDFDGWDSYYFEPSSSTWIKWTPENDVFGPPTGFVLADATSYIKVVPKAAGTFSYTLKLTKVEDNTELISQKCTLVVKDGPVSPIASIGETQYASLATAVLFAKENNTISLSKGNFSLDQMLVIEKPLTISGAGVGTDGTGIQCRIVNGEKQWSIPAGKKESEYKHLLAILNGSAGQTVTIQGLNIVGALASGLNAQSAMKVVLKNVGMVGNANAGLLVHSEVEATNIYTVDNIWGGVNVDKGASNYTRKFTFDAASSFGEPSKIWAEKANAEDVADLVVCPKDQNWSCFEGLGGKDGKVAMYYWMNSKLTVENVAEFYTDKTLKDGFTLIYANGNPITVEASGADKVKISAGPDDVLEVATAKNPIIFGGAKFADVESSSITMKSGEVYMLVGGGYLGNVKNANVTVNGGNVTKYLVGGGYGPTQAFTAVNRKTADVTNASVKINKGAIVRYLISGGLMYAKTTATDIQIREAAIEYALGGGYAPVGIKQSEQTDFATNVNTIETAKFLMTGGTVKGAICLGGGYSYSYTKNMTATIDGVAITGGLYGIGWNGRSDKVNATIKNSSFTKPESGYSTIASLVRGKADEISMAFNDCTFADQYECYLSADKDWQDGAYPTPVSGKTTITFVGENTPVVKVSEGMQDVTVIGAEVKVEKFLQKKENTFIDKFEVPSGKTWSFQKGMAIGEGVTLTNNGTLNLPASAIMAGIAAGGTLSTDATSADVVKAMNEATSKSDLSSKTFSIACKDGVIASNETVAKKLLNEGKAVMVLSFSVDHYSIASFQRTLAKITNLPDSVVFGTEPIKLAFNLLGTEVTINGDVNNVVAYNNGVLAIKKPGTVTFDLKVKKDANGDGKIDDNDKVNGNFTYDADAANTQVLKVNKRKVTLTEGLTATDKTYDGTKTVTLKKGETLKFSGKLGTDATGLDLASGFKGELTDANAGENKEVIVTAALAAANGSDSTAFYELAPITSVKAKVTPAAATVKADDKEREYGVENPEFTATITGLVEGDKLDGILKFTCSATKESLVKTDNYDIVPYGLTSNNYEITFETGKLTVNAVAPVIELTEAKTVLKSDNSAKEIQLKAKLIHVGGVKTITSVTFVQGGTNVAATLGDDGFYTGAFDVTAGTTYSVKASATAGDETGESKAISIVVDALTPQEVSFGASVMPTMVYGNEMTLSATSPQAAATGKYTYSVADADPATITEDGKLKATGVGKVTLTVTRAADANYSAAVATKTIEITPKPITVEVGEIKKVYDGTTAITLPTFTLKGAADGVSVNTKDLKLSFASKNAGNSVKVLMPELTLTGDNATNYTLIQPTNVTGKIKKAELSVKVKDVTRMWNQRYTKYEFEATGLVNDETLSTAYSGEFKVTENGSELKLEMGTCPNYDITPVSGILTVELGTPKAVVYGTSSDRKAMIVDEAGYTGLTASEVGEDGYANILDESGKVIGQSLNKIVAASNVKAYSAPLQTKAVSDNWNQETFTEKTYGGSYEVAKLAGDNWAYESTNANVLTVDATGTDIVCTPVSTGKATILAINKSTGEVKILNLEVAPAELTISATDMDKTYDGTTLASGTPTLAGADGKDVALDLSGITFNFADKKAGDNKTITPSQPLVLIGSEANNYVLKGNLTGGISQKEVTVKTPLSAYYNGKAVMELTDYASNDRISGDIVPIKVTFDAATVGEHTVNISMGTTGDAANYTLAKSSQPTKGNILKSTIVATLPDGASSSENLKSNIKLTVRETGETVTSTAIGFNPTIKTEGSGSNAVHYVNGGETDNYSVVYDKNQIGFKSEQGGDSGSTTVSVSSVSLDKTELTLPRQGTYTLKATINPSDASDKSVTWKSSDESVATVDANGKVTALKVGKATITVTTVDGGKTASCEVTVDFATGLEEALANTQVYAKQGNIYVNPVQPLQLTIVNMIGKVVYNARISSYAQIPVAKGIYIVKLTNAGNTVVTKVNVY